MSSSRFVRVILILSAIFLGGVCAVLAQDTPNLNQALSWRSIGPYRGGRVTTVSGVVSDRSVYYMGATGGGVWKTVDAGINWKPISDGYFKTGSVGDIEVSQSDPNIIYVGMGEACLRANISHGDGVYKSTDAGKTWTNIGLRDTSQIGKIRIDPRDPNVVYVAAVGHPYGPNEQRGVFRSRDGGSTWQKILFVNDKTGAVDLAMDPKDSLTIYATTWQVLRTPWGIDSIGSGGGLYKTTDGGDHWTELKDGLPKGPKGKIGVTVSPVDHNRVWATVEAADDGGIYRSDDAGKTWKLLDDKFEVRSRQYYYGHIFADTQQLDTVYTFSSKSFLKSTDGGTTYQALHTPHGDYHDLWIDPSDDQRMIDGDDGGATITFDGGKAWSSDMNQATAQFYTVDTDNAFPYRVYGAQQDNTTVGIASRTNGPGIDVTDWYEVGGGESGYVVPDPKNSDIVYAGAFWGLLTRYDHRSNSTRNISAWPDMPGGRTAAQQKYRFQWTYPIAISPADPGTVYIGANVLLRTRDQGQSWEAISPDLTRDEKDHESSRLEDIYSTIFSIAPSPLDKNLIWTGSDDGLIHLTRDGGKTWANVTPPEVQRATRINIIEASPTDAATAYVAANRYQVDDFKPYIYRTHDFGKTWKLVATGIPEDTFVRTVRQDRIRKNLLFAGTETGVYVSFDDGDRWQSLQLNLPVVPITDLKLKEGDLVASTQGRSFWILDNISPLEQFAPTAEASKLRVFKPETAYRVQREHSFGPHGAVGQNPPAGVVVDYDLAVTPSDAVTLEIEESNGKTIATFSSAGKPERGGSSAVTAQAGLNRFAWNMRYPNAHGIDGGTFFLGGTLDGPQAIPGEYKVKVSVGGESETQTFVIKKDPRVSTTETDFRKQLELSLAVRDKVSATHDAINQIRKIQSQIDETVTKAKSDSAVADSARNLNNQLTEVLNKLFEPRFTGFDDQTLIYPLELNNRLASLQSYIRGDYAPTRQDYDVFKLLSSDLDNILANLKHIFDVNVPAYNELLKAHGVSPIEISKSSIEKKS